MNYISVVDPLGGAAEGHNIRFVQFYALGTKFMVPASTNPYYLREIQELLIQLDSAMNMEVEALIDDWRLQFAFAMLELESPPTAEWWASEMRKRKGIP